MDKIIGDEAGDTSDSVGKIGRSFRKIYENPARAAGNDVGNPDKDPLEKARLYTVKTADLFTD